MTRRHLLKAKQIAQNPHVSLVVPLMRRTLWFLPPATIQVHGQAVILDWTDQEGPPSSGTSGWAAAFSRPTEGIFRGQAASQASGVERSAP